MRIASIFLQLWISLQEEFGCAVPKGWWLNGNRWFCFFKGKISFIVGNGWIKMIGK
jgi:hypothetical protein